MVADMGFDIEIIGVPIMRAKDGLALSSRNGYLTAEQRKIAPALYKVLSSIADKLQAGERDLDEIIAIAGQELNEKASAPMIFRFVMPTHCWKSLKTANVQ